MNSNVIRITDSRAVYTVLEVAHLLSLSRGTTYTMIRSGDIPAKKIGNRWVVPKTRFHAWLNDLPEATTEDVAREFAAIERKIHRVPARRASGDEGVIN